MNKNDLNREIVLCRSTVKKAKVRVIRKLIKKIKILRSCKNENLKEKKFRKARRLTAEIHEMKSLRPDYVMKFALLTENYMNVGSNTKLKRKRNACAKLAKHKEIVKKVNDIRGKFLNWREVLPLMIQTAKKSKENESEAENDKEGPTFDSQSFNEEKNVGNLKEPSSPPLEENKDKPSAAKKQVVKDIVKRVVKNEDEDLKKSDKAKDKNKLIEQKRTRVKKSKKDGKNEKNCFSMDSNREEAREDNIQSRDDEESTVESQNIAAVPKFDDPFFIGKKVVVPKLLQITNENGNEGKEPPCKSFCERPTKGARKSEKNNRMPSNGGARNEFKKESNENDLHPSWKAKKIQMIKPFEGKKIIFQ